MKKINVVITAGGTNEQVDEVRKITNMSTGALGVKIAQEVVKQQGQHLGTLYYICSKHAKQPAPFEQVNLQILHAESAIQLLDTIEHVLKKEPIHYFIHSAAVSDYTTDYVTNPTLLAKDIASKLHSPLKEEELEHVIRQVIEQPTIAKIDNTSKISSKSSQLMVVMKQTEKIIAKIKEWSPRTFLVGFKLLNGVSEEELFDVAFGLLRKNRCNLVLANDLSLIRKGTHVGLLVYPEKKAQQLVGKDTIASTLVETMFKRGETRYPKSIQQNKKHHIPDDVFHTFQQIGEVLYNKNLLPIVEGGTYGNMSVFKDNQFYITGRNVQKGNLTKDILVEIANVRPVPLVEDEAVFAEITYNGGVKPSIDTAIHHFIYHYTDHQAILHVHTDQIFDGYPLTDYNYACGTEQEMHSILAPILENPQETVIQMNKHGLIVMGQTLEACLEKLLHLLDGTLNMDPLQPAFDQDVWQEWTEHMLEIGGSASDYEFDEPNHYYVIKEGVEKLGIVFVKPEKEHLVFALYSLKKSQGKGRNIASRVLHCLSLLAKANGLHTLQLVTKHACGVKEFYEKKQGFTLVQENDFIHMKKDI